MDPGDPTTSKVMLEGNFRVDGRRRVDAMEDGGKVIFVSGEGDTKRRRALGGESNFKGFAVVGREEGLRGIQL